MRISVFNSEQLQGVIVVMRALPREVAKEIRAVNKKVIQPVWQEAVLGNAVTALQVRVLADTARVTVTDKNVILTSGTIGKSLRGGGTPRELVAGTEFGSDRFKQFGRRIRKGKVVFPAAAAVIPRIASLWIQTVIRTTYEQLEKVNRNG